ncbi:hypothetical protein FW784_12980 [Lysobacter lacus]|uniref:Uncharacterized protein n=1 Tax=Cognatilysobacter lacus TaxID=1643323 RepID=A0A5D8YKZ8_9GAMM|nr:hypothetical protein FW784_12980 [Lysobacter lacus]
MDLLADAAYHHQLAKQHPQGYEASRSARASVVASCLSIECLANCLLSTIDVNGPLASEVDKMSALGKIDIFLLLRGLEAIDRGGSAAQQAAELIKARNDYVHPKISTFPADLKPFEESETHFVLPFTVNAEFWPALKIPKQSLVWDSTASGRALRAVASFFSSILIDRLGASKDDLAKLIMPRVEFAHFAMPAVYEEYVVELGKLATDQIDFSFLQLQ